MLKRLWKILKIVLVVGTVLLVAIVSMGAYPYIVTTGEWLRYLRHPRRRQARRVC
jgi:uncharacterized protein (DUF2062 family)